MTPINKHATRQVCPIVERSHVSRETALSQYRDLDQGPQDALNKRYVVLG
jgi:hypothetical protein